MTLWDRLRLVMIGRMKPPLFVRPLTDPERAALRAGLRSPDAFTLRRCQVLLASADGLRPAQIAARFGCASQSARNAIRAFAAFFRTDGRLSLKSAMYTATSGPMAASPSAIAEATFLVQFQG